MPRKRATKNAASKKTQPTPPEEISPEEQKRREAVDLLLKDFDKQVESRIAEMEREAEAIISSIHTLYKVELIKLPHLTRNMKWEDYVAQCQQDESNPTVLSEAISQVIEDVRSEIDPQIIEAKTALASTAKKRGRQVKSAKENEAPVRQPARKGNSASKVLADSLDMETPATTASRSTRGRNKAVEETPAIIARPTRGRNKCEETPANNNTGMPEGLGRTPMITPKFNIATPLSKTVSRVARANEVLVSLSGSPVMPLALKTKAAKAEAANNALIPVGKGKTLNLPMGPESGALEGFEGELDNEALDKLAAIHASLGNMLKLRAESTNS